MTDEGFLFAMLLIGVALGAGLLVGHLSAEDDYKAAAVERQCAEYDAKTGEWQWIGGKDD